MGSGAWALNACHHAESSGFTTILPTGRKQINNKPFTINWLGADGMARPMHPSLLNFGYRFWHLPGVEVGEHI